MAVGGDVAVRTVQRSRSIIHSLSQDDEPVCIQLDKKLGHQLVCSLKKNRYSFTDVTLLVDGQQIRAHKIILCAFSPYFEALLSPNMLEGNKEEIKIRDMNASAFEIMIDFAYTGMITYTHNTVQDLLETANFLGVKIVQHECVKYIVKQLDSQNCADIYNLGKQIGEEFMFKSAMKYFIDNFVMLSKSSEFLNMPPEMIFEMVDAEDIQYVEPDTVPIPANQEQGILRAVLRYVAHDESKRLALLPGLLQCLRLPVLLPSMLTQLKENEILKKSPDSLALIEKAAALRPELSFMKDAELWRKPRNNKLLVSLWSRPFAGGGQVSNIVQKYNDALEVPITAHITAMKIHIRRWDGRQVWGGYEVTHSNGYTIQHGGKDYGHEVYEFTLGEGEVITSVTVNAGFMIDSITFNTNKNRVLGPYGGPGGSTYHNSHSGKDKQSGYLVCTSGAIVDTQGSLGVNCLKFIWAHSEVRVPEPIITASDYSDIDSGEDLSAGGEDSE